MDQGDEDAIFINDFEEQIIEAVQDTDLASCFILYQEARARLRERARHRGFWPTKGPSKGKGKKGFPKGSPPPRRTLAERIANSTCRLCLKPGHWKRECPQRQEKHPDIVTITEETQGDGPEELPDELPDFIENLPSQLQDLDSKECFNVETRSSSFHGIGVDQEYCLMNFDGLGFREKLKHALQARGRSVAAVPDASAVTRRAQCLSQPVFQTSLNKIIKIHGPRRKLMKKPF